MHDSRRHYTTSFSENVVETGTSVRGFIILRSGEGLTSFNEDNNDTFSGESKVHEAFRGVWFLGIREKSFSQI